VPHPTPTVDPDLAERARRLHRDAVVIDASSVVYRKGQSRPVRWDRYTDGGVTATNHTVTDPDAGLAEALGQVNDCRRWIEANADKVRLCLTADDIRAAHASGTGGIVFGPQDTAFLDRDLGRLGTFYDLGVRILQLTYQQRNTVGDGCGEPSPGKLSRFGIDLVREMEQTGVLVDLSHTSEATSFDVIDRATRTVVLTHAHPYALTPHIRAKSDALLKAVAETGGVIGLTTLSTFVQLDTTGRRPTIADYLAHIDYLVDLVGPDHVGIGSDLDESLSEADVLALPDQEFVATWFGPYTWQEHLVEGLTEAAELPAITAAMLGAGYDEATVRKILGGNFLRVFDDVWAG